MNSMAMMLLQERDIGYDTIAPGRIIVVILTALAATIAVVARLGRWLTVQRSARKIDYYRDILRRS